MAIESGFITYAGIGMALRKAGDFVTLSLEFLMRVRGTCWARRLTVDRRVRFSGRLSLRAAGCGLRDGVR